MGLNVNRNQQNKRLKHKVMLLSHELEWNFWNYQLNFTALYF